MAPSHPSRKWITPSWKPPWGFIPSLAIALSAVVGTTALRILLNPWLDDRMPFELYLPVLAAIGWILGVRIFIVAAALAHLLGQWFFIYPQGSLMPVFRQDFIHTPLAILTNAILGLLIWGARRYHAAAGEAAAARLAEANQRVEVERRLATYVSQVRDYAIFSIDTDGFITSWNEGVGHVLGYDEPEFISMHLSQLFAPEDVSSGVPYAELAEAARSGSADNDRFMMRRDEYDQARPFFALGRSSAVRDEEGRLVGFTKVMQDATWRHEAERDLAHHAAELEQLNNDLREFAYIVSHDLKEPLRGISSTATFALEDHAEALGPEGKQKLETIRFLAQRTHGLLEAVGIMSRIGRERLTVERTNLCDLFDRATAMVEDQMRDEENEVVCTAPNVEVRCDPVLGAQLLMNLILNGLKYNQSRPRRVEVGANPPGPGPAVLYVRDNGIGIEPRHHQSVFRMFKRLHDRSAYGGGTGAGLAIVRKIIERHGGRAWIDSAPGRGTTVYFTLEAGEAQVPGTKVGEAEAPQPGAEAA